METAFVAAESLYHKRLDRPYLAHTSWPVPYRTVIGSNFYNMAALGNFTSTVLTGPQPMESQWVTSLILGPFFFGESVGWTELLHAQHCQDA